MKYIFTKRKDNTTISPSERHLGYYKSLIVYDREERKEEMTDFSHNMLLINNIIINAVLTQEQFSEGRISILLSQ